MFSKIILHIFLCGIILKDVKSYNVALVEYPINEDIIRSLSPIEIANRNAKVYGDILENIKKEHPNLDLVLFPESALVNGVNHTIEGYKGATFVPSARENVIPCTSPLIFSDFFKLLSCIARKHRVYLLVNLTEKKICVENCSTTFILYNTNVVFDREGKVIARYRKHNLYLESFNTPSPKTEIVTFNTDFGETFGTFTCFDILFETPSLKLVKKGIKNFLFPTFWFPELPFLTTVQVQQMWAYGNDVNLLTSGTSYPKSGSGAVGIFLGARKTLAKEVLPRTDNYYLYQEVPKTVDFNSTGNQEINHLNAEIWDAYTTYQEDLSEYSFKKLNLNTSKRINETLCQNKDGRNLCCEFQIETSVASGIKDNKFVYDYALVARSGMRSYGNGAYFNKIEVCGLLACSGSSIDSCGKRFKSFKTISWPVTFKKIEISASFKNSEDSMQYPNSLQADFSPISPTYTTWSSKVENDHVKRTFSTKTDVEKILTFAIFGRIFD